MNKIPIIWVKLPIYLGVLELLSSSNLCYWEELLRFLNPQIRAFGGKKKKSQPKNLTSLPVNYARLC